MRINQELIDIITILDDYDYSVHSVNIRRKTLQYYSKYSSSKIYRSTFEEILRREFIQEI